MDHASNPVPYAAIMVKDDSTKILRGTISDLDGNFRLAVSERYSNDTLKISSVGFETLFVVIEKLTLKEKQIFRLLESVTTLETILFQDLTPKELLVKCIKEIPKNYRNVSFNNKAFYWKTVMQDSVYKSIEESHITVQEDHSLNSSTRSFTYDSTTRTGASAEGFINFDNIENLFYFDFIRTGSGITNLDNLNEWKLQYVNVDTKEFINSTVIEATRIDKLGKFKVYINSHDYSFARVEFSYKWPSHFHIINSTMLYKLSNIEGIVQYQKTDKKYSIKYLYVNVDYSVYKLLTFDKVFSRRTDFEFTLLSSLETEYNTKLRAKDNKFKRRPVIVNSTRYCSALTALGCEREFCT